MANITLRLLCEGRPRDDEPGDTAITAGQIVMSATWVNRIKSRVDVRKRHQGDDQVSDNTKRCCRNDQHHDVDAGQRDHMTMSPVWAPAG